LDDRLADSRRPGFYVLGSRDGEIAGAFAELQKAKLVAKLRGARERKKAVTGGVGRDQLPDDRRGKAAECL